jgi:hypothetical protein
MRRGGFVVTLLPKYQSHCCPNIIRNGDKLLLRNQATKIAISLPGQIEAIMRAYIMIVALLALAIFALVYTARTQDRTYAGFNCAVDCSGHEAGYRWAEQHSIDDEDYCPDGDSESFYEGCIAYVRGMADQADNGIGVGTLINPDADDDDDNK